MKTLEDTSRLIDTTVSAINFCFSDRKDIFFTTSFGYQSALLFALISEAGLPLNCISVQSQLSYGDIEKHRDILVNKFNVNLTQVNRDQWLAKSLNKKDFMTLNEDSRKQICRDLKREPVMNFIKENNFGLWITGIRREQTLTRKELRFIDVTDMGVVKIAPMAIWTNDDVKRALDVFNLPSNEKYVDLCKETASRECGLHF